MVASGRRREQGINRSDSTRARRKKVSKKRPALPGRKIKKKQQQEEVDLVTKMAPTNEQKEKGSDSKRIVSWPRLRFMRAYPRSPDQNDCYICGVDHIEHYCPYNYIYGGYDMGICSGECTPGPGGHRITSRSHCKFLRCFIRVNNLPPGFMEWDLEDLFTPFGPLLMWDVPWFTNEFCGCTTEIPMRFGVVVFKKRADGEKAINALNGYEAGGHKLRVDWVYPSCV